MKLIDTKLLDVKFPRSSSSRHRDIVMRGFPKPVIKLEKSKFWDEDSVDAWLQKQIEAGYNQQPVAVPKAGKSRGRKKNPRNADYES